MENMLGVDPGRFVLAAAAVAIGLVLLVGILWFIRNRPSSPFIRGGKNRQPRLAVLDAAAIDTRRRLVLVRRDDVEHLVMIGGPTDIVIESRIMRPPQAAATITTAETARPPEHRATPAAVQPAAAQQRAAAVQPPVSAPVSAMGPALYGETAEPVTRRPAQGPTQAVSQQQRPVREEPQPVRRPSPDPAQSAPGRQVATGDLQPRPLPVTPVTGSVSAEISPEDILDAARSRVLSAPAVEARAVQQVPVQQAATAQKAAPTDFERMLDAEISGDLQRLTPDARARPEAVPVRPAVAAQRREPVLGSPAAKQEPSIEDEMNRMLGEMSAGRKP